MNKRIIILFSFILIFISCKLHSEIQSLGILCDHVVYHEKYSELLCNNNDIVTFTYYFIPDDNKNTPTKIVFDPDYFQFVSYSDKEYKLKAINTGTTDVSIRTKVSGEENYDRKYDYKDNYEEFCRKNKVISNTTMKILIKN